jgi:Concanavalin A-like lectin/glucanases superfamily
MKNLIIFFLTLCSYTAQAQITAFNNAAPNTYYGIGGYSFSQTTIPNGIQTNPYVVSGPSPQNDFSYAVSAVGGITNRSSAISTNTANTPISIQLYGNNVRKFSCQPIATNEAGNLRNDGISFTANTNLGNTAMQIGGYFGSNAFVGFSVSGDNEYIVSITASFPSAPSPALFITIGNIMVGDNTPKNVALNFDGVNDYVAIPSTVGNVSTNGNFTVTCWIKPDATQPSSASNPDENDIISKWAGPGAGANNNYPFVIRYLNSTSASPNRIRAGQWDGTNFPNIVSTTPLNDGKWHHVAFVQESAIFKLYIDGVQEGITVTDYASNSTDNNTPLQIGRRGNGRNYFKGEIDEVRIWNLGKTATQIADERFCKTPNSTNLVASYNFGNGVPHDNNPFITQVQDAVSTNHGTLNNFAKTGDVSNFVTGQVKYVKKDATGSNNGSSWTNAFLDLQSALAATTCNDLFDVWVAGGTYKPAVSDIVVSFNIPTGMSIYGGFAGNEESINQRNRALILTTNETTLSGDLGSNDILSNFTQNRGDNSRTVVDIIFKSNIIIDGFSIRGGGGINTANGGGINAYSSQNIRINHCKIFDNYASTGGGISVYEGNDLLITNTYLLGNSAEVNGAAIFFGNFSSTGNMKLHNTVVAGNTGDAIFSRSGGFSISPLNHIYTNCTFANNGTSISNIIIKGSTMNLTLKNSIMYGNTTGINVSNFEVYNQNITYSLVQGITTGTGNLNGTTTNPQFVNLPTTRPSTAGDYRLKWCSKAIGAGTNAGISPLDLDRNPRNFNGTADMGAYEFLGNTPSQVNNSSITGTIDSPTYTGGAIQTITSTAKILAPAGAIDFKAPNSITLNPGFEARSVGKYFKAEIGANVGCSN